MSMVEAKCPQCNETISINDSRDFSFCNYCGYKIENKKSEPQPEIQPETQPEIKAESQVVGPTVDSLLERAEIFLDDKDFKNAKDYFNKVLDINPRISRAYWGLLMCNVTSPYASRQPIVNYNEYHNALKFAESEEIRQEYISIAQQIQMSCNKSAENTSTVSENEGIKKGLNTLRILIKIFTIVKNVHIGILLTYAAISFIIFIAEPDTVFVLFGGFSALLNVVIIFSIAVSVLSNIYYDKLYKYDSSSDM